MKEKSWDEIRVFVVVLVAACMFLILVGGQSVFAHNGGLNAQGCHNEYATGDCHCHRDQDGRKLSPPVRCEKKPKDDKRSEMDYVATFRHAREGQIEESVGRGRVDCETKEHAIEGDFAPKWKEASSQSLRYARVTGKKAGILLILKNKKDNGYIKKLCDRIVDQQDPIDVFAIGYEFAEKGESVFCPDEI